MVLQNNDGEKMKKLHLICNAHLDPVWQWEWEEGAAAALSTFQSAANILNESDSLIFCHGEVTLYQYIERYAPELFGSIQELVKQGKWKIMGGWFLQPDCLMPVGEALVRQVREGELYFEKKFGVKATTAICPDAFGHSRGLVQILKKCGQDSYLFVRPYSERECEKTQLVLPSECFLWEGYDGSQVKAYRMPLYASVLGGAYEKMKIDIDFLNKTGVEIAATGWGVGNHGGGPSRQDLADLERLMEESDIEIVHSYPEKFFAEATPTEIFADSLISCMPGCYTTMIGLKQAYRKLEREFFFTEKISSIATLKGICQYPEEELRLVVEDMMNVQFHDILPGSSVRAGEDNGFTYINHGFHILNQLRATAFFGLCKGEPVAEENTFPIMVFNPRLVAGERLVECELSIIPTELYEESYTHIEVYDSEGHLLPTQTIKEDSTMPCDFRKKIVFKAELAPLSITRLTAKSVVKPNVEYSYNQDICFDNGEKQVVIKANSGLIESYKVHGKEYAKGKLFEPFVYEDNQDSWGGTVGNTFEGIGKNPKAFVLSKKPDGIFKNLKSLEVIEDGEIFLGAEAFFDDGYTRMRIGYKLYKKGTAVDVEVQVFPAEVDKAFKLHLPINMQGEYIGGQVFGTERLYENGRECIAQDFVAVKNGKESLQVITPSTYASSFANGEMHLTLLRTPVYCAQSVADRPIMRENRFHRRVDMGEREYFFRMDVVKTEELQQKADEYNERPYALNIFPTVDTKLDNGFSISHDNPEITAVTFKKSVQRDGYILRLFNNSEKEKSTTLHCGELSVLLTFGKYEVKTVVYNGKMLEETTEMLI